jgi:hypothetical protein
MYFFVKGDCEMIGLLYPVIIVFLLLTVYFVFQEYRKGQKSKKSFMFICTMNSFAILLAIIGGVAHVSTNDSAGNINLDISASNVASIEIYYNDVPARSQMKIVTKPEDIQVIVDKLSTFKIYDDKEREPVAGRDWYGFRFNMTDESSDEFAFVNYGETELYGVVGVFESAGFRFGIKAGIVNTVVDIWGKADYAIQDVPESQLPLYGQKQSMQGA